MLNLTKTHVLQETLLLVMIVAVLSGTANAGGTGSNDGDTFIGPYYV